MAQELVYVLEIGSAKVAAHGKVDVVAKVLRWLLFAEAIARPLRERSFHVFQLVVDSPEVKRNVFIQMADSLYIAISVLFSRPRAQDRLRVHRALIRDAGKYMVLRGRGERPQHGGH